MRERVCKAFYKMVSLSFLWRLLLQPNEMEDVYCGYFLAIAFLRHTNKADDLKCSLFFSTVCSAQSSCWHSTITTTSESLHVFSLLKRIQSEEKICIYQLRIVLQSLWTASFFSLHRWSRQNYVYVPDTRKVLLILAWFSHWESSYTHTDWIYDWCKE